VRPSIYDVRTEAGWVKLRWWYVAGISSMWMLAKKLIFSCKEVGMFCTRISSLDGIKKLKFAGSRKLRN